MVLEMAQDFARPARARLGERIREVRVFGSRARGDTRPASDLDLFVLVDRDDRATRLELYGIANDVMLDHLAPSPLVMRGGTGGATGSGPSAGRLRLGQR